jgi:hypothetical protein
LLATRTSLSCNDRTISPGEIGRRAQIGAVIPTGAFRRGDEHFYASVQICTS